MFKLIFYTRDVIAPIAKDLVAPSAATGKQRPFTAVFTSAAASSQANAQAAPVQVRYMLYQSNTR